MRKDLVNRKKKKKIIRALGAVLLFLIGVCIGIIIPKENTNEDKSAASNKLEITQQDEKALSEDGEVKVDEDSNEVVREEVAFYEIETKYCKLYFPEIWEEQIEVKYSEEFGYKVEFYGVVDDKKEQHLFDVCFNSDDGELLGYLDNDGAIVNISIDVMDLEFDDTWKQEEVDQIYSMQEEMNYVADTLTRNENYVEP